MKYQHRSLYVSLSALALSLLLGAGMCETKTQGNDAGPVVVDNTCSNESDCQSGETCVGGLCMRRCSVDDVCDAGQYCSANGFCEQGCRSSDDCDGEKLCSAGSCIEATGSCVSKADCPEGLVCKNNACTSPPDVCAGPEDCPGEQLCNGFTQVCFDPSPTGCNNASDCADEAGCEAGCTCDSEHTCVSGASCSVETELQDCGVGGLCQSNVCVPQPGCNAQADCDPMGLYCDLANHICTRTSQCNDDAACVSQAPATYCNMTQHRCEVPTCINGGVTCNAGDECNSEGRCVPPAGSACSSNLECCPDDSNGNQSCAAGVTEYCDIPAGALSGDCRQGCRSDSDCNMAAGESCNALHQCSTSSSAGDGGDGAACQGQEECRAGYFCGVMTHVCYEKCETEGEICPETGKTCKSVLGVKLCMDGGGGVPAFDAGALPTDAGSGDL